MDRIQTGQVRGHDARVHEGGNVERLTLRDIDEGSVKALRGLVEDGVVDQRVVERRLVEVGRVGDVYEVARGEGGDAKEASTADCHEPGEKGEAKGHDKKLTDLLLTSLVFTQTEAVRDELSAPAEQDRERDVVSTRVVGDRLVLHTATGPAHTISMDPAELARLERGNAAPASGSIDE